MKLQYRIKLFGLLSLILCTGVAHAQNDSMSKIVVQKNESIELVGGSHIEELIIYGDNASVGQVKVADGVVRIDNVIYKYSFSLNEWHHISFPIDFDLKKMSNLQELGLSYQVQSYNSTKMSTGAEPWENYTSSTLKASRGYRISFSGADSTPAEVTFIMDQLTLDTESSKSNLYVSLDMTDSPSGLEKVLYVKGKNIKSNVLKLDVAYSPTLTSMVPMNYAQELESARIIRTSDKKGVRVSLPTSEAAKVVILNKKGDKVLKKLLYTSPAEIDLSDLKKRDYQMIINYGTATATKEFSLKK